MNNHQNVNITVNFGELLRLAKAEAIARKSGNIVTLEKAIKEHNEYKELIRNANAMKLNCTYGDLL